MRPRRSRPPWALVALLAILAGLALVGAWAGGSYRRARTCYDATLAHLDALEAWQSQAQSGAAAESLAAAGDHLRGVQAGLGCLRGMAAPFLPAARLLGWLPRVGADVAAAPALLDMVQAAADGGVVALDALGPLAVGRPDLPQMLAALEPAGPALAEAGTALAHARAVRGQIDAEGLSPRVRRLVTLADRVLPLAESGIGVARLAPALLGAQGPRTYLVLAQNDDERRPTGGWISGVGLVRVDRGRVEVLSFGDSYAVDNLEVPHDVPPDSMRRALWADIWLLRDSNWSPDFPSAAAVARGILERDRGVSVDGVIAVDQEALRRLVAALEPLSLPSGGQAVTAASLLPLLRRSWAEPRPGLSPDDNWAEWAAHRKDVMGELVAAMMAKVQGQDGGVEPMAVAGAAWSVLRERHILVSLSDPAAAELLRAGRWDGGLLPADGDYLQVVDANVGFNKVDPSVERGIDYEVDARDPARVQATAAVRYQNSGPAQAGPCVQGTQERTEYEQLMAGCLWDYVRFYAPGGSQLAGETRRPLPPGSLLARYGFTLAGDGGPTAEPAEKGKEAFGLFFVVAPGESLDVGLSWRLPSRVVERRADGLHYRLLVQKQSGTGSIPLRVTVLLPDGARVVEVSPEPAGVEGGRVRFELRLSTDQEIEVVFERP